MAGHAMAYDTARGHVVLVYWRCLRSGCFTETWGWDGERWVRSDTVVGPNAPDLAMAYDERRRLAVAYDGLAWEWDGLAWTRRTSKSYPLLREKMAMAYDEARGVCVMYGGYGFPGGLGQSLADTWEWDGTDWLQRGPPFYGLPDRRQAHAMAYDGARQRIVMVGGERCGSRSCFPAAGTWAYYTTAPAHWASLGSGCPGTAGTALLAPLAGSLPWAGDRFDLELSSLPSAMPLGPIGILGVSSATWGPFALPLDLGVIGAPGCAIHASIDATFPLAAAGGRATWSIPLPSQPSLVGLPFFAQGLVFDPPANPAGLVVSDAGQAVIGAR